MALQRENLGRGIYFSSIMDKRFKLNTISLHLTYRITETNAAANAIMANMLTKRSGKFPDPKDFFNHEAGLYAAEISGDSGSIGDAGHLEFAISAIDDALALEPDERVTAAAASLLIDCVLSPFLRAGRFPDLEHEKRLQIEKINAELNDKMNYALEKAIGLMCAGEPYAIPREGTVESVGALSGTELFETYRELINGAVIDIICVGRSDFSEIKQLFSAAFADLPDRIDAPEKPESHFSPVKSSPAEKTDLLSVNQAKLVIGFKTTSKDFPALILANKIFGGSPTSKLFQNVREKMSLCYYCASRFRRYKGLLFVESGVTEENLTAAKTEIIKQLQDVSAGNFSDEDIEIALSALKNDLKSVNDSAGALIDYYYERIYRGGKALLIPPEETLSEYLSVDKERIVKAAASFVLDTIYILSGDGSLNAEEKGGDENER